MCLMNQRKVCSRRIIPGLIAMMTPAFGAVFSEPAFVVPQVSRTIRRVLTGCGTSTTHIVGVRYAQPRVKTTAPRKKHFPLTQMPLAHDSSLVPFAFKLLRKRSFVQWQAHVYGRPEDAGGCKGRPAGPVRVSARRIGCEACLISPGLISSAL